MSDVVGCIFISKNNSKFLLLRRSDKDPKDYYAGYWSILTGHIDDGELPYQAMDRECNEEIGTNKNLFKFNKYKIYSTPKKNKFHLYYTLVPNTFEPYLNQENMDYLWCDMEELPTPLYPGTKEKIASVLTLI